MTSKKLIYYNPNDFYALTQFRHDFFKILRKKCKKNQPLVLLCIGTDRVTGDCLGPLIGQSLIDSSIYSIYGTLQNPVHAQNLDQTMNIIFDSYKNPFIIAIDSCLGTEEHIGYITLSSMPLNPGQGVCKKLRPIGNLSITGIVDRFSEKNFETIQNTRLKTVFHLASFIKNGIEHPKSQVSYPLL